MNSPHPKCARVRLEASERELNQYSRSAGLIRVQGKGRNNDDEATLSVTNESLVQLNNAANEASADRAAAEDRWQTIASEPVLSVPQVLTNSAGQNMFTQRTKIQAYLAQERERHLDGHPIVQALDAQIDEFDRRIDTIGNSIKRSVYIEYKAALEKEESLKD